MSKNTQNTNTSTPQTLTLLVLKQAQKLKSKLKGTKDMYYHVQWSVPSLIPSFLVLIMGLFLTRDVPHLAMLPTGFGNSLTHAGKLMTRASSTNIAPIVCPRPQGKT